MDKNDLTKVEKFLRKTFANPGIGVRARPKKDDSAEVYVGEDFVGVLYEDNEDGEKSFNFQMAILDIDLEG